MDSQQTYSLSARFYDADYAAYGRTEDIKFYAELAAEHGGPVLEMGCGTGRTLLPIARAGLQIHGVDFSPEMLSELHRKLAQEPGEVQHRVAVTLGDIRTIRLKARFKLVTAPFRVVQHLLERAEQRAWLRNVAAHLEPGGALCFDVFQPDYSRLCARGEPRVEIDRTDPDTGVRVRRITETVPYPEKQLLEIHFRWVFSSANGPEQSVSSSFLFRWFTRPELENLLELAGFEVCDYWGSFGREPFGAGSQEQIIRARKRVSEPVSSSY